MSNKTLTLSITVVGSLAFGVVASQYASNSGANAWMCAAFFVGCAAIGVLVLHLLQIIIKSIFDSLIKGTVNVIEEKQEISEEFPLLETEPTPETALIVETATDENTSADEIKVATPREGITEDMIFKPRMYEKYLTIEPRLIKDGYLNEDIEWIAMKKSRKDIKKLIIFLDGLIKEGYFMPFRDSKIKMFFEKRYNIELKQNFEASRRKQYEDEYKIIFYNYPF